MRQASKRIPESAEKTVRDIRRATRRHHSAEEKIRIVLEGLRGEDITQRVEHNADAA
jgi:transposase